MQYNLRTLLGVIFIIFLMTFALPVAGQEQAYVPGEVIVKLKSSSQSNDSMAFVGKAISLKGMSLKGSWGKINTYHFKGKSGQSTDSLIKELHKDPTVDYAEPNYLFKKSSVTSSEVNSMSGSQMKGMLANGEYLGEGKLAKAEAGWSALGVSAGSKPIVAVIDTGLDVTHSVFVNSNALWVNTGEIAGNGVDDDGNGYIDDVNGWNFVSGSGAMVDDDSEGHGTHVAGIVLSASQNIFDDPIAESKVTIMPLKFLDSNGVGKTSDAIEAVYYALNNGATVLNNSWGGPSYSAALQEAIEESYVQGVSFIAAAGNEYSNNDFTPMYPASYGIPHIISIAATNDADVLAYFSNYGPQSVHIGSPGDTIYSVRAGGGFRNLSGTSMAAPYVAGLAAAMKVEAPTILGYQIRTIISDQSDKLASLSGYVSTQGRINLAKTISAAKTASIDTTQPDYAASGADRNVASDLASGGGGCGMIYKLSKSFGKGGSGANGLNSWYVILVFGMMALPLMFMHYLKLQQPESRRRHKRFLINSEVSLKSGDKELVGSISSISLGGVCLDTEALLEQGGVVAMSIKGPDGTEVVDVEGRIVWREAKGSYGVQFEEAADSVLGKIARWTKSLAKAS